MKFNGRNILISATAQIGQRVRIGDNVTIYDNVEIGDDTVICNDCVIGEPSSQYYTNPAYTNRRTTIASNCLIRSHAIIYNGNSIASHVSTGHRILLREVNSIGTHSRIGNFTELHGDAVVGRYCSLHSNVCVVEHARLGDFVWISPGTILTNDPTPPSTRWVSPVIGNYTFIAVNCIIMPGVEIGEHCLIGASSVVTRPIPSHSVAYGNPAKVVCDVRAFSSKGYSHYPWPLHFDRGMPWEGVGWEAWQSLQDSNGHADPVD